MKPNYYFITFLFFILIISMLNFLVELNAYTPNHAENSISVMKQATEDFKVVDYPISLITLEERCVDEQNQRIGAQQKVHPHRQNQQHEHKPLPAPAHARKGVGHGIPEQKADDRRKQRQPERAQEYAPKIHDGAEVVKGEVPACIRKGENDHQRQRHDDEQHHPHEIGRGGHTVFHSSATSSCISWIRSGSSSCSLRMTWMPSGATESPTAWPGSCAFVERICHL